jgi:hypothetical protein
MQASAPSNLDYISPSNWTILRNHIVKADEDAYFTSCAMEFGICLCCGGICIFFCHSCIYESFLKKYRREGVNKVNTICFQGTPVFSTSRDKMGVYVNSDYFINSNSILPNNQQVYSPIATPSNQYSNQQMISVTIPEGVRAGQNLNVVTPDGQTVLIIV